MRKVEKFENGFWVATNMPELKKDDIFKLTDIHADGSLIHGAPEHGLFNYLALEDARRVDNEYEIKCSVYFDELVA